MKTVDLMSYEKGKKYNQFKKYVNDYLTKKFQIYNYTYLDIQEYELEFRYALQGQYFLPSGFALKIGDKHKKIWQMEIIYLNWENIYKHKSMLHKMLNRLFYDFIKKEYKNGR